jgi:hypothetical protein
LELIYIIGILLKFPKEQIPKAADGIAAVDTIEGAEVFDQKTGVRKIALKFQTCFDFS